MRESWISEVARLFWWRETFGYSWTWFHEVPHFRENSPEFCYSVTREPHFWNVSLGCCWLHHLWKSTTIFRVLVALLSNCSQFFHGVDGFRVSLSSKKKRHDDERLYSILNPSLTSAKTLSLCKIFPASCVVQRLLILALKNRKFNSTVFMVQGPTYFMARGSWGRLHFFRDTVNRSTLRILDRGACPTAPATKSKYTGSIVAQSIIWAAGQPHHLSTYLTNHRDRILTSYVCS